MNVRMRYFFILIMGISLIQARAEESKLLGTVVTILDGNTLEVRSSDNRKVVVLLYGIDCPELGQAFGDQAKSYLEKTLLNREVTVEFIKKDRVGNHYALVTTDIGVDPRIDLLREGLAWTLEDTRISDLEPYCSFAQQKKKGLWQESKPTPPWVYRRQQSMLQPKGR